MNIGSELRHDLHAAFDIGGKAAGRNDDGRRLEILEANFIF